MSKVNYANVTMTMANTFELAGCPLSPEQHIVLAGCIAVYGEKWIGDERERAAKVCERDRMVRGGEVFAAAIRKGI